MTRGDLVTVAGEGAYGTKPRPALILQHDRFSQIETVVVCFLTTTELDAPIVRVEITPQPENGLRERSWVMVDKVQSIRRTRIGKTIGVLQAADLSRVERALLVFLGLAG